MLDRSPFEIRGDKYRGFPVGGEDSIGKWRSLGKWWEVLEEGDFRFIRKVGVSG
jgi:hypothetical protein